jgi:uncharacterized protein
MTNAVDRQAQLVIKSSKHCNLRCSYCYEMAELHKREAMSREDLRRIYQNVRGYYLDLDRAQGLRTEVRFIWHGGEPLLLPPQFYWDTFADQQEIFGEDLPTSNLVQTNLTVLCDERLRLLRDGFDSVGVSIDLFGGLRVNLNGRDQQHRVLRNMEVLRKSGVPFGCITVLTRANLRHVEQIYRFFEKAGISFRVLPLFDGAYADQHSRYDLSSQEIAEAYKQFIDLWLQGTGEIQITPLNNYIQSVVHHLTEGVPPRYLDRRSFTPSILVNTNGDCYCSGDPYGDPEWTLGNLITTPLAEIVAGERMDKACRAAEARMALNCTRCKYFGSCSGFPIVEEDTPCARTCATGTRRSRASRTRSRGCGRRATSRGSSWRRWPASRSPGRRGCRAATTPRSSRPGCSSSWSARSSATWPTSTATSSPASRSSRPRARARTGTSGCRRG